MTVRATPAGRLPSRPRTLRTPSQQTFVLSLSPADRKARAGKPKHAAVSTSGSPTEVARGLSRIGVEVMQSVARTRGPFAECLVPGEDAGQGGTAKTGGAGRGFTHLHVASGCS